MNQLVMNSVIQRLIEDSFLLMDALELEYQNSQVRGQIILEMGSVDH